MADIILFQPRSGALDIINTRLPLGLMYAASFAHREGYKVKIIDQRLDGWRPALERELKKKPSFFGTTCMTGPQIAHALEAAGMVREAGVPVVFGGVHPTIMPEQTLQNPLVDMVVRGEGEETMLELVRVLDGGMRDLKNVKGLSYKKKGKITHNPDRPFLKGEEVVTPPYELVDMKRYSSVSFHGEKSYSIMASRGCPFSCGFCYNHIYNRCMWRPFPLERIIESVKMLVEDYGAKTLYFEDDNVCTDRGRFEGLLRGVLGEYDLGMAFQGIRVDVISRFGRETFRLMEKASELSLDMGVESVNQRVLGMVDKSLDIRTVKTVLRKLEDYGFTCKFNFIIGLPTETMREVREDVRFGLRLNERHKNSYSLFNIYTPYPGTKLFELAKREGFCPPGTLEGWSAFSQMGWLRPGNSWLSRKEVDYLKNISFLFMFASPNIGIKVSGRVKRRLLKAYSPVARMRLQSDLHSLFFEKKIIEKITGV